MHIVHNNKKKRRYLIECTRRALVITCIIYAQNQKIEKPNLFGEQLNINYEMSNEQIVLYNLEKKH